jgi:hypothetical protein
MGIACNRWTPTALASGLLLGGPRALAQQTPARSEPPLRVLWTSEDPACDGDDVAERALGLVSPGIVPRPLRASVEVRREGPLWVVRLDTQSGEQSGHRVLRADSCQEIEDALALLLAMTMESRLDAALPEPALPGPAAQVPAPAPTAVPEEPFPVLPPEPESGPGLLRGGFVRVAGKAGLEQQPGLALGVGAAAGVRLGDFEVGVSGTHWPATAEPIPDNDGARLLIRRENLGLRGCWNAWRAGDFVLAPCVMPELTWFFFESEGLLVENLSGKASALWSVGASAEVRYELFDGALAVSLAVGANLEQSQPFTRELLPPEGADAADMDANAAAPPSSTIYTTEAIGPRLEIGVDARF